MDFLPKELEDIIMENKGNLDHVEKFKTTLRKIKYMKINYFVINEEFVRIYNRINYGRRESKITDRMILEDNKLIQDYKKEELIYSEFGEGKYFDCIMYDKDLQRMGGVYSAEDLCL